MSAKPLFTLGGPAQPRASLCLHSSASAPTGQLPRSGRGCRGKKHPVYRCLQFSLIHLNCCVVLHSTELTFYETVYYSCTFKFFKFFSISNKVAPITYTCHFVKRLSTLSIAMCTTDTLVISSCPTGEWPWKSGVALGTWLGQWLHPDALRITREEILNQYRSLASHPGWSQGPRFFFFSAFIRDSIYR